MGKRVVKRVSFRSRRFERSPGYSTTRSRALKKCQWNTLSFKTDRNIRHENCCTSSATAMNVDRRALSWCSTGYPSIQKADDFFSNVKFVSIRAEALYGGTSGVEKGSEARPLSKVLRHVLDMNFKTLGIVV